MTPTMNGQDCCLGVFAKMWTPGCVKTRLAATIGEKRAAEVYRAFVETCLSRFSSLPATHAVAYDGADAEQAFAVVAPRWKLSQQAAGDLGERIRTFFDEQLAAGFKKVVLLGTDSPNVPLAIVEQAFRELDRRKIVFGPAEDGGYYLVGAAGETPRAFDGIPWSTPQVWELTQRLLDSQGRLYATLPTWYDVDNEADLERLLADLCQAVPLEPLLQKLKARVEQILSRI